jgi:hypothetical protein
MTMPTKTEADHDRFSPVREAEFAYNEMLSEADELLQEIIDEGRQRAALSEVVWFRANVGWDEKQVADELRRMSNVLRLRGIAGTAADREAAAKEAATAADVLAKEGPKVAAKIAELETKLRSMENDARLSARRVEEQSQAVDSLRKLAPENVAKSVRDAVNVIEHTLGREIANGEIRANELQCCLDRSRHRNEAAYLEGLARSFPAAVMVGHTGQYIKRGLSPEWPSIRSGIESELSELAAKLETQRAEYAAAIAAAEAPLSYYCN